MVRWTVILIVCCTAGTALGDERYVLRENVRVGQVIRLQMDNHRHVHSSSTTAGKTTSTDQEFRQVVMLTETVLTVKNGSATAVRASVDPASHDTQTDADGVKTTDCSFAGKAVTLRRREDGSVANDFPGQPDATDLDNLNSLLNPDDDLFPDHPVAVGEMWDASVKLTRHAQLQPGDQLLAECRLDSVSRIDGKEMGQISCSCGVIFNEGDHVEEDVQWTSTNQVDIGAGQIVWSEMKGSSTFSNPAGEATHLSGGTVFHGVEQVLRAATQP